MGQINSRTCRAIGRYESTFERAAYRYTRDYTPRVITVSRRERFDCVGRSITRDIARKTQLLRANVILPLSYARTRRAAAMLDHTGACLLINARSSISPAVFRSYLYPRLTAAVAATAAGTLINGGIVILSALGGGRNCKRACERYYGAERDENYERRALVACRNARALMITYRFFPKGASLDFRISSVIACYAMKCFTIGHTHDAAVTQPTDAVTKYEKKK